MFETEEFEDGEVDGGVETETAFVWAECGVVLRERRVRERREGRVGRRTYLDTETAVDLRTTLIVFPDNAELENAFGNLDDLERFFVLRVGSEERL